MSVPPAPKRTVAAVNPAAPSGTDSGLFAPGTGPADAAAVPVVEAEGAGAGIGSVLRGTSSGVHPTSNIADDAAAMLPVMKATRRVKVRCVLAPAR
jgi:hypothetical protein